MPPNPSVEPIVPAAELRLWRAAGRALLARTIAELAYENLISPVADGAGDRWTVTLPGDVRYAFRARQATFDAWRIAPESITRYAGETDDDADDPVRFILDAHPVLGLSGAVLAELVRDLTATHVADVRLLANARPAEELADLSHEDLEAHQTGHPCLILNKGRLGFSAADAARYTPEAAGELQLIWFAVAPDLARYTAVPGLTADALLADELDAATRADFAARIRECGGDPDAYVWLPVHPFQADEIVLPLFAPQLADGSMILLGPAPDRYRPLQSIRTLTNLDRPGRRNVKVPLMIRNTLIWRGLCEAQTGCAPPMTTWLQGLRDGDEFLRDECRVAVLGEVASVSVAHPTFAQLPDAPYRFHELLGAIWRQPVHSYLEPGERARTMATLLLEGSDGRAVVAELVQRSGLDPVGWLRAFLRALLPPLLHYLYRYGTSFTPHGENVVLISDATERPARIAIKDLSSDVEILTDDLPEYAQLPPEVFAKLHRWPATELAHSIQSAICAGHFRFFADVVERHLGVPEELFWSLVREPIDEYHARFPELADRFASFDLLGPRFAKVALNREQLTGGNFHDRAERDADFDLMHGSVANPLHRPEPAAPTPTETTGVRPS